MFSLRSCRLSEQLSRTIAVRAMVTGWLTGLGQALGDLVFPWSCSVLRRRGNRAGPFCRACRADLLERSALAAASACPRCGLQAGPFRGFQRWLCCMPGPFTGLRFGRWRAGPYEGALSRSVPAAQARAKRLAGTLAQLDLLVEARGEAMAGYLPDAWVVPVPLHWWRHWRRGYNQAEALAHGLARRLKLPVHRPLHRMAATPQAGQARTNRAKRSSCTAYSALVHDPDLAGRTVLLVDDVLTTGATCGEAARALEACRCCARDRRGHCAD